MALVVQSDIRSKEELRKALDEGRRIYFFHPKRTTGRSLYSDELPPGSHLTVTNGARSWFARISFTGKKFDIT